MRRSHWVVVFCVCLLTGGLLSARQLPGAGQDQARPGVIFGRVVDADTKQPVAGAIVALGVTAAMTADPVQAQGLAGVSRALTDGEGRFMLRGVRPGPASITVNASGYLPASFGQSRPGGPSRQVELEPGQILGPIDIAVWAPGAIEGHVMDEAGEPVVRTPVLAFRRTWTQGRLTYQTSGASSQTDDRGRYRISGLIPGEYVVNIPMTHSAVPASVVEESRRLMEAGGAAMQEYQRRVSSSGASILSTGQTVGTMVVQTDLFGTQMTAGENEGVYAPVFVPAIDRGDTDLLNVTSGRELTGVDVAMVPVRPVRLSGVLNGLAGPLPFTGVRLVAKHLGDLSYGALGDVARTVSDAAGAFMFMAVAPGEYDLVVQVIPRPDMRSAITIMQAPGGAVATSVSLGTPPVAPPNEPTLSATIPVSVGNRPIDGLVVAVTEGPRVRGTVEFVGTIAKPRPEQLSQVLITLRPVVGTPPVGMTPARPDEHGAFETMGQPPGRYFVTATAPVSGWYFESAIVAGRDVSLDAAVLEDKAIEQMVITFADTRTELRGQVQAASGEERDGTVVVFPANVQEWVRHGMNPRQLVVTRPNSTGQYVATGLPPGTYQVAAVPAATVEEPGNPEFLEALSRYARTITLTRGQKTTLDVRLGGEEELAADEADAERQRGPWAPDEPQALQGAPSRDALAQPVGTGVIAGVVTLNDTAQTPVRRATVRLSSSQATGISALAVTDARGRFAFRDLPEGRYALSATRAGFVGIAYGATAPGRQGPPVALAPGQQMQDVHLTMLRGAAIEGRVTDEAGRPLDRTQVQLLQPRTINGVSTLTMAAGSTMPFATTDDRGMYRFYGVPPGDYVVGAVQRSTASAEVRHTTAEEWAWAVRQTSSGLMSAGVSPTAQMPAPGRAVGAAPVFFPGTTSADAATLVTVGAGDERTGVDFVARLVPTATIAGRVEMPDGSAPEQLQMSLFGRGGMQAALLPPVIVRARPDGQFTASGVTPGPYVLMARAAEPGAKPGAPAGRGGAPLTMWAHRELQVEGLDVTGMTLSLAPGLTASGRVTFEGTTPAPADVSRVTVRLMPATTTGVTTLSMSPTTSDDGTFRVDGLTPGTYRFQVSATWRTGALPTWVLARVMVNGVDVADTPIDVVSGVDLAGVEVILTDKVTEVSGSIADALGRPVSEYTMVVFPVDPAHRTPGTRRTPAVQRADTAGRFRVAGLPPGEYYLAAITEPEPNQTYDAAFFESLVPLAIRITLADGERKVQNIKLAGGD